MKAIDVLECQFDLFPAKFVREDRVYEVEAVTECKTMLASSGQSESYHFWVRCQGELLHLCQTLPSGQWALYYDDVVDTN